MIQEFTLYTESYFTYSKTSKITISINTFIYISDTRYITYKNTDSGEYQFYISVLLIILPYVNYLWMPISNNDYFDVILFGHFSIYCSRLKWKQALSLWPSFLIRKVGWKDSSLDTFRTRTKQTRKTGLGEVVE